MDEQHKFLINIINDLFEASNNKTTELEINNIIKQMIKYTHIHFSSEEIMLKNSGYPGYGTQKYEHNLFSQQVLDFQSKLILKQMTLDIELLTFLKEWWTNHILGHDRLYKQYFLEKKMLT